MNRLYCILCIALIAILPACGSKYPQGRVSEDHAVTNIWRSGEVLPGYNYFYSGVELEPNALMGIDKAYSVEAEFWTPIDLSSERLNRYIVELDRIPFDDTWAQRYRGRYQGAWVLDPDGTKVGMWYSKKDWGVFDFPGNNVIIPYPPSIRARDLDLIRPLDD
jgi:hypothetical protein